MVVSEDVSEWEAGSSSDIRILYSISSFAHLHPTLTNWHKLSIQYIYNLNLDLCHLEDKVVK